MVYEKIAPLADPQLEYSVLGINQSTHAMCKVNLVNCSLFPAAAGVCVLKAHYSYIHIRSKQKKEEEQLRRPLLTVWVESL